MHRPRVPRYVLSALVTLVVLVLGGPAIAEVRRYALVVGHNQGQGEDAPLLYANHDAQKFARVLQEVGDFAPSDVVTLTNRDASEFRAALIELNDRIRQRSSIEQSMLMVYYSGHADGRALRMGPSRFQIQELAQLVRGSAASFRLLVVDACRSGALTRVKGGRLVKAFELEDVAPVTSEGLAFLTASSASEDAQESDELKGSFFTHALVSGLLGAADANRDGRISLDEAYRHAYHATLRRTSQTQAGAQHPTYQYDFKGRDALILTRVARARRGTLGFPSGLSFLVFGEGPEGEVVAEVAANAPARHLSLPPGAYFLRGRAKEGLYEGLVEVQAAQTTAVDLAQLEPIRYARWVRKGGASKAHSQALQLSGMARTRLPNAAGPCIGAQLGYRLDLAPASVLVNVDGCRSRLDNRYLTGTADEVSLRGSGVHVWDFGVLSVELGLGLGAALFLQALDLPQGAERHTAVSPFGYLLAGSHVMLGAGTYLGAQLNLETHLLRLTSASGSTDDQVATALRASVGLGLQF